MRRTESGLKRHWRLVEKGHDDDVTRIVFDWVADHLMYLWDLLWGIVKPILTLLLIATVQLVDSLVATTFLIYLFYIFIISKEALSSHVY